MSQPMLAALCRAHRRADRRAVQRSLAAATADRCCTARARSGSTYAVAKSESAEDAKPTRHRNRDRPLFRFQYKGLYPALEEASKLSPRLRGAAGAPRRRDRLQRVRRQPAARRCGGRAVPRPHDRRDRPHAAGRAGRRKSKHWKLDREREENRRRADPRDRRTGCTFLVDVGLELPHARPRRRRRSPAAKRSASAWPARSAAACAACCTCSTSRRSACTRATTRG